MSVRKQRIDKYYTLAKERGYRARSAFKLLEINKKFGLLQNARVAIDLCAAPGGWLQILAQEMPSRRKIIGVDLDPIKPLGGDVITFVGDITTVETCKTLIGILDGHMADIVVHDGAPNFGASNDRDVFVQNDLVLSALKLACRFLGENGAFVTKVFRSDNFHKILAVLEELFGSVDVTKPLSSRNESAEVFVVCRKYKKPDQINYDWFSSDVLFREDGQEGEDYLKISLSEYVRSKDKDILERCLTILPDFHSDLITPEITEMLRDIKLLGFSEKRKLLKLKRALIKEAQKGSILPLKCLQKDEVKLCEAEETSKLERLAQELAEQDDFVEDQEKDTPVALNIPTFNLFDGRIFKEFESGDSYEEEVVLEAKEEDEKISCSDSMEMDDSEMECTIAMKEKGENFAEETIDRYLLDSGDVALPGEKRPSKINEERIEKKRTEYLSRKKARALRRAKKVLKDIVVEDDEEEAIIYKKILKNSYKKDKLKPRLVFPGKGGRKVPIPKGKGKIKFIDRRMKHDLLIEKRRKTKNRR